MWLLLTVLALTLPGALAYDYNVGGMAAAAAASILLLLPIILMVVLIVKWRDWYMKKQFRKGRVRVPRRYWSMFKRTRKTKHTTYVTEHQQNGVIRGGTNIMTSEQQYLSHPTLISTPRSEPDRKSDVVRMYNVQSIADVNRQEPVNVGPPPTRTITYTTEAPAQPSSYHEQTTGYVLKTYETKGQTITFPSEEEPVIEADVLTDDHVRRSDTPLSYTVTRLDEPQSNTETYYVGRQEPDDLRTTVISLGQQYQRPEPERDAVEGDSYHVKLQKTQSQESEIFITPAIPASNVASGHDDVTVIRASRRPDDEGTLMSGPAVYSENDTLY